MASHLHLLNSLTMLSVFRSHHAQYCKQTIGRILKISRKCDTASSMQNVGVLPSWTVIGVLIICHSSFSSPQPHLQPLLPRVPCLLQYNHSLCLIPSSSALAPLFPAPRHSQVLNYTTPNQLFRVSKEPRVQALPYGPSTLSYLTSLSSPVGFSYHWTQVRKLQFSKAQHRSRKFSPQYCQRDYRLFLSDADSSQMMYTWDGS